MEYYFYGGGIILGLVVWGVCAYYCYKNAPKFHRNPRNWAILGIFFGPFALFTLYLLPKGNVTTHQQKKADQRDDLYEVHHKK